MLYEAPEAPRGRVERAGQRQEREALEELGGRAGI